MANSGIVVATLRKTMTTANLSVDQGHGSQLVTISSIAAKDVHPWESPQWHSKSYWRDFCVTRGVDIVTNRSISLFPVAGQVLLTRAKPLFEREGKWFSTHSN